jgi:hypothetical protein
VAVDEPRRRQRARLLQVHVQHARLRLHDLVQHRRVDGSGGHVGRVAAVGPQRADEVGRVPLVQDGGRVRDGGVGGQGAVEISRDGDEVCG